MMAPEAGFHADQRLQVQVKTLALAGRLLA